MWVLAVLLLGVQGYTDPYINGKWAVQGLGQLNATFMTHVCVEIKGAPSSLQPLSACARKQGH